MGSFCNKAKSKNDNNLIAIKEQEQTFIKYKYSQEEILKSKEVFKSQYRKVLEQRYYALNPKEGLNFEQLQLLFPKITSSKDSTIQRTSKQTIYVFLLVKVKSDRFYRNLFNDQQIPKFWKKWINKDQSLNSKEFQLLVEENQNLLKGIKSYQKFSKTKFINWADGNLDFGDTFTFNLFVRPDQEKKIIEEKKYQIENDNMYIISPKWWDKWKQYVNTTNEDPKQQQNNNEDQESLQQFLEIGTSQWQARPGPIDNKDIAGENEGELKVQGRNYGAVGKEAWENLLRWYGITDKKLEFKRKCHFEDDQPQKKLQSTQGSEKNNDPPKILQPTIIQGFETNNKGNVLYKKCFKLKMYENSTMHDIRRKLFQKFQIHTKNCSEYLLYMMKINEDWKLILDLDSNIMSLNITSGTFFTMTKLQIKPKSQVNNWKLGQKSLIKDPTNDSEQMCIVQNFSEDLTEVFLHIEGQSFLNDFKQKIQENIQSFTSQIGGVSRKTQYAGLQNLGNTCYMNAALQSLISTNYFNLFLINEKYKRFITVDNSLTKELSLLAKELNNTKEPSISPQSFQDAFIKIFPKFRQYEAQDADEFIADLLSHISKELNENENKQTSVTDNLFQGEYLTERICKNCKILKEEKDLKRIFHLNIQDETDIFRLRLLIFMNFEFIYDSQEKLNNLKKKDLLKKTFIFKSNTPIKMRDLSQKIQSFMGLSQYQYQYQLANIYEKEIQNTFIINNNNENEELTNLGIHHNRTLYLYQQLGSDDEAENEFQKISKMFNYPSQNFQKQDLVDFSFLMNGEQNWIRGKIEQVYNPSSSCEYEIVCRSQQQNDNKLEYIRIKEKQHIVKFREKLQKKKYFEYVPVVNYMFHSQRKQYILTLKPIILFLPLQYLSLQELKVYIYKQIQRFISDHFTVSSPFQSSNVSQQDIIKFFGNQSFPYKIRVLDQDRKCLYCEKIRLLKNNTNWNCPGCEVDPILLNFQKSTKPQIILEWNDVSLTKKLEKRKNEDEEKNLTNLNLEDCLKKYKENSEVELICECKLINQKFTQNSYLIKPPINLIINFQKYTRDGKFIERYVDFQDNDLNIGNCLKNKENKDQYNYNLYAVINAVRKKKSTHYTAYIKKQGRWYEFNDSQVTLVDKVQSNNSYMLFYTIKDIPTDYDLRNSDFT